MIRFHINGAALSMHTIEVLRTRNDITGDSTLLFKQHSLPNTINNPRYSTVLMPASSFPISHPARK